MKTMKKALVLAVCAMMLVAGSVAGTMAYLTSTKTVNNTFTIGKVAIELDEAWVNTDGEPLDAGGTVVAVENAKRVTENTYKLMPGKTYTKDPTIKVAANSEDCYLFVKVVNGIANYETKESSETILSQMTELGWKLVARESDVYYYYGFSSTNGVVNAGTTVKVFNDFTIDEKADSVQYWNDITKENAFINVTAYAIQVDGFDNTEKSYEENIADAWNALDDQLKNN